MEDATVALMVEYMDGGSLQDIVDAVGGGVGGWVDEKIEESEAV